MTFPAIEQATPTISFNSEIVNPGVPVHNNASAEHAALAGWNPKQLSFDKAYLPEQKKLVARSEDTVRNSAMLQGGIRSQIDSVVGDNYRMSWEVSYEALRAMGVGQNAADDLKELMEETFAQDATSQENWFDASGRMNLSELCGCGVNTHYRQGEVFIIDEYQRRQRDAGNRPFATSTLMINPDRVMTPYLRVKDPLIKAGFRQNKKGYSYGAFVLNRHPSEVLMHFQKSTKEFAYLTRHNPTGRAKWQHIFVVEAADQTRGRTSIMANIKKVRMLDKFEDTMLLNAINRAAYAAVVESADPQTAYEGLQGSGPDLRPDLSAMTIDERNAYISNELAIRNEYYGGDNELVLNGSYVAHTLPGDKMNLMSMDGNVDYLDAYETAFLRHLARGLNISYEELSGDYSRTNYSGSRAGKIQSELSRRSLAAAVPAKQARGIATNWMEEMFSTGRIKGIPGRTSRARLNLFLNYKEALCQFDFHGPGVQHIDPVKGVEAAKAEMLMGAMTLNTYCNMHHNKPARRVLQERGAEIRLAQKNGLDLHLMMGVDPSIDDQKKIMREQARLTPEKPSSDSGDDTSTDED